MMSVSAESLLSRIPKEILEAEDNELKEIIAAGIYRTSLICNVRTDGLSGKLIYHYDDGDPVSLRKHYMSDLTIVFDGSGGCRITKDLLSQFESDRLYFAE
jgi:hypothetical protein